MCTRRSAGGRQLFLATEHDASIDEPKRDEIYQVATIINLAQFRKLPDGNNIPVERNADDCQHQP